MNQEEQKKSQPRALFAWTAPEFIQQQRGPRWFLIAGIVVLIAVLYALLTRNWTMAVAIIVLAAVYEYTRRQHPPKEIEISISELGIHVGHMFFPYSNVERFWMFYENGIKTLHLRVHKRFFSDVVIQLEDQDPVAIREYLVGQIPEWEGKHERLSDIILRLLKL
ncbi:hypothetical protein KC725_01240 [Candidatus Peregrinibacteria bacterium]|nr:hypothetical protein [Candidatus Peregrinibacteria bacterium]